MPTSWTSMPTATSMRCWRPSTMLTSYLLMRRETGATRLIWRSPHDEPRPRGRADASAAGAHLGAVAGAARRADAGVRVDVRADGGRGARPARADEAGGADRLAQR